MIVERINSDLSIEKKNPKPGVYEEQPLCPEFAYHITLNQIRVFDGFLFYFIGKLFSDLFTYNAKFKILGKEKKK